MAIKSNKNLQTSKISKKKRGLPKGTTNNPKGRVRGSKNKKTLEWEEFGRKVVEESLHDVVDYMAQKAKEDPERHFEMFIKLLEYFKPKLARTELTGKNGEKLEPSVYQVQVLASKSKLLQKNDTKNDQSKSGLPKNV